MPSNLVSIIIPVRYRADLTKVCLDSVFNYTNVPFEVILVQEGEDFEITKLLQSYQATFIQNKIPKGFAGAMNTGLDAAKGDFCCFLNNDTVVTPGWLSSMLDVFVKDLRVGLVTPTYSEMPGRQVIDYNKGEEVEYVQDPLSLKGVCFLIKKEAMDKIGRWDESFGLGGGDDNDIC